MSDIKLFHLQGGKAVELLGDASDLEKPLQTLIDANLDTLLVIRFLASEYSTRKACTSKIDSQGLDESSIDLVNAGPDEAAVHRSQEQHRQLTSISASKARTSGAKLIVMRLAAHCAQPHDAAA